VIYSFPRLILKALVQLYTLGNKMSHTATWKVLEDLMIELRKKGASTPPNTLNDLRNAKLMIKICESEGCSGDAEQKVVEYLGNVESSLINEAQKTLSSENVDEWLRRIKGATTKTNEEKTEKNAFITGVPRDQKWVRIEPNGNLTSEKILEMAKENDLSVNVQRDGRLVIFGQSENTKEFLKRMTSETNKK
jgi:hypothetical protein